MTENIENILGNAQIAFDAENYEEAIAHCDKALAMDFNFAKAHYLKGLAILLKDIGVSGSVLAILAFLGGEQ